MDSVRILPFLVLFTTVLITLSVAETSTESPANTTHKCAQVGFQFFFKNLNQSGTYRVAVKNSTIGYPNATFRFVRSPHSAFLVFRCPTTCDVFTAWRDFNSGNLRAIRNELNLTQLRPGMEYSFGIEKQGGLYFWCDPEGRSKSQFTLVPIGKEEENGTEVCSPEYGNYFNESAKECDLRVLEKLLIFNDLQATSGFNKRALLMSIVLMILVAITLVAIFANLWINRSRRTMYRK